MPTNDIPLSGHIDPEDRCEYGKCENPGAWRGEYFVCSYHTGMTEYSGPDFGDRF